MFDDLIPSGAAATADLPVNPDPTPPTDTLFRDSSTASSISPGAFEDLIPGDRARLTFYTRFDDGPQYEDGRTAAPHPETGIPRAEEGVTIAVDPDQIPYGSRVRIPSLASYSKGGDGVFVAHDTGGDVRSRRASGGKLPVLDVYVDGQDRASAQAKRDAVANSVGVGGMAYQVLPPHDAAPAPIGGMFADLIPKQGALPTVESPGNPFAVTPPPPSTSEVLDAALDKLVSPNPELTEPPPATIGHQLGNAVAEVRGGAAAGTLGILEGGARLREGANAATPESATAELDHRIDQAEGDLLRNDALLADHPSSLEFASEKDRLTGELASLLNNRADLSRVQPGDVRGMSTPDQLTPEVQARLQGGRTEDEALANAARDAKTDTGTMFGQDPALKDTALARAARAGGEVVPLVGAGMVPGVGTVAAAGAAGLQAKASAYDEFYNEAISRGESHDEAEKGAQDYSDAAALRTVPEMAAFLGTGKVAASVVSKLISPSAPAAVRALVTAAAATTANAAAGTGNQLIEQAVAGRPLDASYSLERGVQDTLFGGMHTVGEMGNRPRPADVQQAMKDDVAVQNTAQTPDTTRRDKANDSSAAGPAASSESDAPLTTSPIYAQGDTPEQRAQAYLQPTGDQPATAVRFEPGEDVPATLGRFPRIEQSDGATVVYDPATHAPDDFEADDSAAPADDTTSTANASTDAQRAARGFAPAEKAARRDFGQVWDQAKETLADDPTAGQRLVAELNSKPRAATDAENALLLHEQINAQGEHDAAVQAVNDAPDDAARVSAQIRLAKASDDLFNLYEATKKAGTETGRGLNARKMLAAQDYTLPAMLNRRRAAEGGKPLNPRQTAEVEAAHEKVAEAQAKVRAHSDLVDEVDAHLAGDPDWTPPADPDAEAEAQHRAELMRDAEAGTRGAGGVELLDAVRDAGGLPTEDPVFQGELQTIREAHAPVAQAGKTGTFNLFRRGAPTIDELTSRLRAHGFDVETPDDALNLIYSRLTSKRPEYGFPARAEAQSGMAGSEAYFRRQRSTPLRTPEELRPVQERWTRAMRAVAPKTALRLEIVKQHALDDLWQGQKRPTASDGSSPHAAYMDGVVYLSDRALRTNPDQVNRINFLHEIAHHFERALPGRERLLLEGQRARELQSGKSPLHDAQGRPRADVDPRAFDTSDPKNFSEWLAERIAVDNDAHFAGKIDRAVAGEEAPPQTATARLASRIRRFVRQVWRTLKPGMSEQDISAKFREWLGRGDQPDATTKREPQFARRDRREDIDPAVWEKGPVRVTSIDGDRFWPKGKEGLNEGRLAREAARSFATDPANGILGSHRNADTGWHVDVSTKNIKHALTHSTSSGERENYRTHLEAIAALPDMIRNAIKTGSKLDRSGAPDVVAVHRFHAPVEIGGVLHRARLMVKEARTPEGARKLFYDHSLFRLEPGRKEAAPAADTEHDTPAKLGELRTAGGTRATVSVADLFHDVKPEEGPQFAARRSPEADPRKEEPPKQPERVTRQRTLADRMQQQRVQAIRDSLLPPARRAADTLRQEAGRTEAVQAAVRDASGPQFARRGTRPLTDDERLANAKKSLARRRDDLLRRVAAGDLEPVKRARVQLDAEGLRLRAEHARAKQSFDEAVEKARRAKLPLTVRAMEHISGLARAGAISGYHTLGKLFSFSTGAFAERPLTELAGAIIEHTPGMRRIAAKADMESGSHVASLARFYSQAAGRGMKEAWRTLRTGKSTDTALYGKPRPGEVNRWYDFFGRLHDAEKTPLFTGAMEAYRTKAFANAMRQGLDPHDPMVRGLINAKSYEYALADKLQENNIFAEKLNSLHEGLAKANPATGRISTEKVLLSTLLKTFVTKGIVKTPANYLKQTLFERSPIGLIRAFAKGGAAHIRGVENLTDQEANHITRLMKMGMVGTAMMLWGMYDATKDEKDRIFGGYYQPGDKRSDDDAGFGRIRIAGRQLPHWATHLMILEPAQMGSTIVRVARGRIKKTGEEKGYTEGALQAALAPINNAPVISSVSRIERQSRQSGVKQAASNLVTGLIPQLVQNIAEDTDAHTPDGDAVPRGPKTVAESVKMAIPGLRGQVDPKFYRGISDEKRQQIEDALRK